MYNGPRYPLHYQNPDIVKANQEKANPSYESFRDNEIHESTYKEMDGRPSNQPRAWMRRYPNGTLDVEWAVGHILTAIGKAERGPFLTPIEQALLTVVFPLKYREMEPQAAAIMTQLSDSEKSIIGDLVEARIKEQMNLGAGEGGGSVPGRTRTVL